MLKRFSVLVLLALTLLLAVPAVQADATTGYQVIEIETPPAEEYPELFPMRSMPSTGEAKLAVFLVQFRDEKNKNPYATAEYYQNFYFGEGVNSSWGYSSVAQFYHEQSAGKLQLTGQVFDWYTTKHNMSYYDNRKEELVQELFAYHSSQGTDFSTFDGNSDGIFDGIVYHFAGDVQEGHDSIDSPWYSGLYQSSSTAYGSFGGLTIRGAIQIRAEAEIEGEISYILPTACHELLHTMGMPDLYSGVSEASIAPGFDLMSTNDKTVNPYFRLLLGWIDRVTVVTGDVTNLRIESNTWDSPGDAVIVTDNYTGLFDEFYVVAYRGISSSNYENYQNFPVVWHVDARLTEDGKTFRFDNYLYHPQPGTDGQHYSAYPFLEELSRDPVWNFIETAIPSAYMSNFVQDSVVGPNSVPSTDTHEGRYTGICIKNFIEHDDDTYLTVDISFVQDTTAPVFAMKASDIKFDDTIQLRFNESVYKGHAWNNIRVTDLDGNPLDAEISLPRYPQYKLEIAFADQAYQGGFQIHLPDSCLQDSSGNPIHAVTLDITKTKYLTLQKEIRLQDLTNNYVRTRFNHFFPDDEGITIISHLSRYKHPGKIEFLRLDYEGNVLRHNVIDNPLEDISDDLKEMIQAPDGSFIAFTGADRGDISWDAMLCIDPDGNLRWYNRDYVDIASVYPENMYCWDGGLIITLDNTPMLLHPDTGELEPLEIPQLNNPFNLPNGKILFSPGYCQFSEYPGVNFLDLQLLNPETGKIELTGLLPNPHGDYWILRDVATTTDGMYLLYCDDFIGNRAVILLDALLREVKSLTLTDPVIYTCDKPFFLVDGGFYLRLTTTDQDHSNSGYRLRRYDRRLELMWETDVSAYELFGFLNDSGEFMLFRSSWENGVPFYFRYYGSEEAYEVPHAHELVHEETIASTCQETGIAAHWKCTGCGCLYSDEGQVQISDAMTLILPMEHVTKVIPAVEANCVYTGLTEGLMCQICDEIFVEQQEIPVNGQHHFGKWQIVSYPTSQEPGYEARFCRDCPGDEYREYGEPLGLTLGERLAPIVAVAIVVGIPVALIVLLLKIRKKKKLRR